MSPPFCGNSKGPLSISLLSYIPDRLCSLWTYCNKLSAHRVGQVGGRSTFSHHFLRVLKFIRDFLLCKIIVENIRSEVDMRERKKRKRDGLF